MNLECLSVQDVTYRYPRSDWQLHACSFQVMGNEIVGIIGPNGSGKSTLLKILVRVLSPTTGKVFVQGEDLGKMGRRRIARLVGYLPQNTEEHFRYTVEEVVALGRFPHLRGAGFLDPLDLTVITQCMIETETEPFRRRFLSQLSGGERQRALLASVLAQEPKLLLLDEPTSALDIHHQVKFFTLLRKLVQEGLGALVVTHDLNLASLFSDRLLLLKEGKIIFQGTPQDILTKELLCEAYGEGIEVTQHPRNRRPMVLPTQVPVRSRHEAS